MPAQVRRFTRTDRVTHLFLIVAFMLLAVTGAARALGDTDWGRYMLWLMGGHDRVKVVHVATGYLMTVGFAVHIVLALARLCSRSSLRALFGPDSLVPTWRDVKEFGQRLAWFLGLARAPRFERWTYLEKFDYWAVFWGIPLLFFTGLMLLYPVEASRVLPGWTINVAALLHRAEAVLAVAYIVLVHLLLGHFRRSTFPLNEAMFSGGMSAPSLEEEKPDWLERLRREGRLTAMAIAPPVLWFRLLYFLFAYAIIALGLYLVLAAVPHAGMLHG